MFDNQISSIDRILIYGQTLTTFDQQNPISLLMFELLNFELIFWIFPQLYVTGLILRSALYQMGLEGSQLLPSAKAVLLLPSHYFSSLCESLEPLECVIHEHPVFVGRRLSLGAARDPWKLISFIVSCHARGGEGALLLHTRNNEKKSNSCWKYQVAPSRDWELANNLRTGWWLR